MNQAFYSGLTGLNTNQFGIDTISNNIANINTVGFKSSTAEFASIYEGSLNSAMRAGPEEKQSGVGSRVVASAVDLSSGTLQISDKSTDLAISGNGWFGVQNENGVTYTRAGNFEFDANRNLVQPDGSHLLGTLANNINDGKITEPLDTIALSTEGEQQPLNFPTNLIYPAQATTSVQFFANLGLENISRSISAAVIDPNGIENQLQLHFQQTENQPEKGTTWSLNATLLSADDATQLDQQESVVTFDIKGALTSISPPLKDMDNNGAPFTIDLGDGFTGVTANSNSFTTATSKSDGTPKGDLIGYTISENGVISAAFSNSKTSAVGKVAIYHFRNNQGLSALSGTHYQESSNSGKAHFWKDSEGNNTLGATILTHTLEGSNVKFEVALSELIIMQRAFDANSKSITTADQMIKKALEM